MVQPHRKGEKPDHLQVERGEGGIRIEGAVAKGKALILLPRAAGSLALEGEPIGNRVFARIVDQQGREVAAFGSREEVR